MKMSGATTNQESRKHRHKYCFWCRRSDWNLNEIDETVTTLIQAIFNENVHVDKARKICSQCSFLLNLLTFEKSHRTATVSSDSGLSSPTNCCSGLFKCLNGKVNYLDEVRKKFAHNLQRYKQSLRDDSAKDARDSRDTRDSKDSKESPTFPISASKVSIVDVDPLAIIVHNHSSSKASFNESSSKRHSASPTKVRHDDSSSSSSSSSSSRSSTSSKSSSSGRSSSSSSIEKTFSKSNKSHSSNADSSSNSSNKSMTKSKEHSKDLSRTPKESVKDTTKDNQKECSSRDATRVSSTTSVNPTSRAATIPTTISPTKAPTKDGSNEQRISVTFSKQDLHLALPLISAGSNSPGASSPLESIKESKVPEKVIVNIKSSTKDLSVHTKHGPLSKKETKVINVSVKNECGDSSNNNNSNNSKQLCASIKDSTKKCGKLSMASSCVGRNMRDIKSTGDPLRIKWSNKLNSVSKNSVDIIKLPIIDSDSECKKVSSTTSLKPFRKSMNARDENISSTSSQLERLSLDPLMISKKYLNSGDSVSITLLNKASSKPPKKRSKLMSKHDEAAPVVTIANYMKDMTLGGKKSSMRKSSDKSMSSCVKHSEKTADASFGKPNHAHPTAAVTSLHITPSAANRLNSFRRDMALPTRYPLAVNERPYGLLNQRVCSFEEAISGYIPQPIQAVEPASSTPQVVKQRETIIPFVARNDPKMFLSYVCLTRTTGEVTRKRTHGMCKQTEMTSTATDAPHVEEKASEEPQPDRTDAEHRMADCIVEQVQASPNDRYGCLAEAVNEVLVNHTKIMYEEPIQTIEVETSVEEEVMSVVELETSMESMEDEELEVQMNEQCDETQSIELKTEEDHIALSSETVNYLDIISYGGQMKQHTSPAPCVQNLTDDFADDSEHSDVDYDADDDDAPIVTHPSPKRLVVVIKSDSFTPKSILHTAEKKDQFQIMNSSCSRKTVTWSEKDSLHEYNVNAPTAEAPTTERRYNSNSNSGIVEPLVIRLPSMKICKDQKVPTMSRNRNRNRKRKSTAARMNKSILVPGSNWKTTRENGGLFRFKLSRKSEKFTRKYLHQKYGSRFFNAYVRLVRDNRITNMLNEGRYAEQLPPELLQRHEEKEAATTPTIESLSGNCGERARNSCAMDECENDDEAAALLSAEFVSAHTQMSPYDQVVQESEEDPLSTDAISNVLTPAAVDSIAKIIESSVHMNSEQMFLVPNVPDLSDRIDLEATPLQEIQPDDIINVLGKETANDATLSKNVQEDIDNHMDENAAKKIEETVRKMSPQNNQVDMINMSTGNNNYFDILGNLNCLGQSAVRTKASLKQMVDPVADNDSYVQFGHGMVLENFHDLANGMAPPLSSQLTRKENPLLTNGHRMIDENSVDLSEGSSSPFGSTSSPFGSNCSPFGSNSPFGNSSPYTNSSPYPSSSPYANFSPYPNSSPYPSSSPYANSSPYPHGSPYPNSSPYGSSSPFTTDSSSLDHHPTVRNIVNHQLNVTFTTPSKQNIQYEDALLIEDIFINGGDTSSLSETYTPAVTQEIEKLRLELLGGIE